MNNKIVCITDLVTFSNFQTHSITMTSNHYDKSSKGICTGNTSLSFDQTTNRITSPQGNIIDANAMAELFPPCIKEENSQSLSF